VVESSTSSGVSRTVTWERVAPVALTARLAAAEGFAFLGARPLGGSFALDGLWQRLGEEEAAAG
jgi:hypothetical protein